MARNPAALDGLRIFAAMVICVETPRELESQDSRRMADTLCRVGSDMAAELLAGETSTPIAVAYDPTPVAWAATHRWRGLQTLEAFTAEPYRRRGLCRILALLLVAEDDLDLLLPVAVFSQPCRTLAASMGFTDVRLFHAANGEWYESHAT